MRDKLILILLCIVFLWPLLIVPNVSAATISPYFQREYNGVDVNALDRNGRRFYQFPITGNVQSYTITATSGSGGTITPSGTISVDSGANQSFAITPDAGYHVQDVIVDSQSIGATTTYTFTNVTANHTISAAFGKNTYMITATSSLGGIVSPSSAVVSYGDSQTFTISPDVGYHIVDVLVDSQSVGALASYTFVNVTSNHTISATFAINTYTITATASTGGAINPSGVRIVNYGSNLTFAMVPDTYYHLLDVQVDGISLGPVTPYSFSNIVADHSIAAVFQQDSPDQVSQTIEDIISSLPPSSLNNPNNQKALLNKMNAVISLINSGQYQNAMVKLTNDILPKTDGCATTGQPDNNDWITTCDAQAQFYPAALYLINLLKGMQ